MRELLELTKSPRVPVSPVGSADIHQLYVTDSGSVKNGHWLTSVHSDEELTDGNGLAELHVLTEAHGDPARFSHGADSCSSRVPAAAEITQLPTSGGRRFRAKDPERLDFPDSARDFPAQGRGDMASQRRRHVPVPGDLPQLAMGGIALSLFASHASPRCHWSHLPGQLTGILGHITVLATALS